MQQIFNEGRVVGLSAYEVYVRHHMEEFGDDTNNPPASERAWLASSISLGTSVLIRISPDIGSSNNVNTQEWSGQDAEGGKYWGVEIKLPQKCRLTASSNIIASMFIGTGVIDNDNKPFCERISDYGFLSTKNGKSNYDTMTMNPPSARYYDTQLKEYAKLIDGVVIQPCTDYTNYVPDLHDSPKVRLLFRNKVTTTFYLMLSGFTDCSVISGTSIYATGLYERRPETGDFIGPVQYPWSSKIIITTPSAIISRLFVNKFMRKMYETGTDSYSGVKSGSSPQKVTEDAFLDYNHSYMPNFYDNNPYSSLAEKKARVYENVTQYSPLGEGINQLAVVSKDNGKYDLPAPYASKVGSSGNKYVYPLDCAAPGTVKAYPPGTSNEEFQAFPTNRPGSYPVIMNDDGTMVRVIVRNGTVYKVPVASMDYNQYANEANGRYAIIRIGSLGPNGNYVNKWVQVPVIRHLNDPAGADITNPVANDSGNIYQQDYPVGTFQEVSTGTDIPANFVSLRNLSRAMHNNMRLDLMGNALRRFRNGITSSKYTMRDPNASTSSSYGLKISAHSPTSDTDNQVKVNIPVQFDQNVTLTDHLRVRWHPVRGEGAAPGCRTDSSHELFASDAELHIDAMENSDGSGFGGIANFAIGIGQARHNVDEVTNYNPDGSKKETTYNDGHRRVVTAKIDSKKGRLGRDSGSSKGLMPNGAAYITMMNGIRFYIAAFEPNSDTADIPDGSIGIGWGMD